MIWNNHRTRKTNKQQKKDKHERQFYKTYYKEHKKNMQLDNYTDLVGYFNVNMQIEGGQLR